MIRSLLDTDIFSEVMKGRNANVVQAARGYLATHEQLTISAVTVMEVSYGLRRAGRTEQLADFEAMLATIEVRPRRRLRRAYLRGTSRPISTREARRSAHAHPTS
ncbi:MAG: hypothetical protein H0T89_04040 [Deltaproteobacteria bacterium]|nr:hypothetical protein [Deltaproteobacteria bacterium]MDQ3298822.1 hypothetical protein [Myxococcota bacterium]